MNRLSYETWFPPTTFVAADGGSVTVRVPNLLFRDWIAKHYSGVINEALGELHRSDARVSFIVAGSGDVETKARAVASPGAGSHSIGERFDRVDYELGVIRRDVGVILAKLSSPLRLNPCLHRKDAVTQSSLLFDPKNSASQRLCVET